jgi:diaminopropionate ammonia-lyase
LNDPDARSALQLNSQSRVLLFNTEGATDPQLYRHYVGLNPEEVK